MHITGEIDQVGGGKLTAPEDAAIYLINFNGHAALVDAGSGRAQPRLMDNIRACGVDPDQIEYLVSVQRSAVSYQQKQGLSKYGR